MTYSVHKHGMDGNEHLVQFSKNEQVTTSCSCKKFEHDGILCRHILHIFSKKELNSIPNKYILHRWTINASYWAIKQVAIRNTNELQNEDALTSMMIWSLRSSSLKVSPLGIKSTNIMKL